MKLGFCAIFCILLSSGICENVANSSSSTTPTILEPQKKIAVIQLNSTTEKALEVRNLKKDANLIRNPKFAFNLPLISGSNINEGLGSSTPYPNYGGGNYNNGNYNNGVSGIGDGGVGTNLGIAGLGVASTLALVKGGVLGGLTAIKAAVLPPLFIGAVIVFLVAGAAFFTCSVINCGNLLGGGVNGIGSPFSNFSNFFNRNGYEPSSYYANPNGGGDYYYNYENQVQPVYQALEEAYKKYGGNSFSSGNGDLKSNQVNK